MAKAENVLSVTLLPEPVNAFALVAKDFRKMEYPDKKSATKADITATWLEFLAKDKSLAASSREPILLMAIARIACNGNVRKQFRKLCDDITAIALKNKKNGVAPAGATVEKGTKGGGFRIETPGVVER